MKRTWVLIVILLLVLSGGCSNESSRVYLQKSTDNPAASKKVLQSPDFSTIGTVTSVTESQFRREDTPETIIIDGEVVPVGPTASAISDDARNAIIAITPESYDKLKKIDWDCENTDVYINKNVSYLLQALYEIPQSDRPHATYAEMPVAYICDNFSSFAGDKLYWANVTITKIDLIEAGSALSNSLNNGNAYAIVYAQTEHQETLQLYVMTDALLDEFYEVGRNTSLQGWPVGLQGAALIVCLDKLAGG